MKLATKDKTPSEVTDPINAKILSISEDLVKGFHRKPFDFIASEAGLDLPIVLERIRAMLSAGVIRRVRQTLMANKLAHGALVAWNLGKVRGNKKPASLNEAFDFMAKEDPFSGHVVVRSTDKSSAGADFHLWTTVKVPLGEKVDEHCKVLQRHLGMENFIAMPAKGIFTLGVGHMRRREMAPGARADKPANMITTTPIELSAEEWRVVLALKEELSLDEVVSDTWQKRSESLNMSVDDFCRVVKRLEDKKVLGRFSTFLEHVKPSKAGERVTRFNGLFHWKVPKGMEERAGGEVGRHFILTHCYWREGGKNFGDVNIMGVLHGTDKDLILEHKKAIDEHLCNCKIPVSYTNVFWGGRSEIKPSEISPSIYKAWHDKFGKK